MQRRYTYTSSAKGTMRHSLTDSFQVILGGGVHEHHIELVSKTTFKPDKVYASAPREPGCFILTHEGKEYDLSIAANHTMPVVWPVVEKHSKPFKAVIRYTSFVPRGYVITHRFTLTFIVEGTVL